MSADPPRQTDPAAGGGHPTPRSDAAGDNAVDRAGAGIDELLGAYALDAVDADERLLVERYLIDHPEARAEVGRFQEVAAALAGGEAAEIPDQLWERVRTGLRPAAELRQAGMRPPLTGRSGHGDSQASEPAGPGRPPGLSGPTGSALAGRPAGLAGSLPLDGDVPPAPIELAQRRRRAAPTAWRRVLLSAAAALALVAGTAAVTSQLNGDGAGGATLQELALAAQAAPGSVVHELNGSAGQAQVVLDESGNGYLLGEGLRPLPKEQTYQLWSLGGDVPVSLGVLGPHPLVAAFPASGVRTMALTVEPGGGVASPTLPPVATSGV